MTSDDRFQIRGAINEAMIDFTIDRGIDSPKTAMIDTTATTVANQNYVDLATNVTNVVDGTVRIVAEDQILTFFAGDLTDFYAVDPGEDFSGPWPTSYAIDTDESGAIRLRLRPTPSRADTINFKAETMVDEDDISDFPGWYHGALRTLATAMSLEALGMDGRVMQARYNDKYKNIREQQRGRSGPQHVQLRQRLPRARSPQGRANF
jgi:hypothetical protein